MKRAPFICIDSCDGGEISTAIYYAAGRPDNDEYAATLRAYDWHHRIDAPDLTVILSVSADVAAARRAARGGHVELFEQAAFQARVARLYAEEAARRPHDARGWVCDQREQIERAPGLGGLTPIRGGWWIASVNGDASIDEVAARVWAAVSPTVDSWITERG